MTLRTEEIEADAIQLHVHDGSNPALQRYELRFRHFALKHRVYLRQNYVLS